MRALASLGALAASCAVVWGQSSLDSFLAPVPNTYAANADIVPVESVPDAATCAAHCLSVPGCISFNLCTNGTSFACGLSGWNMSFTAASGPCTWYRRIVPRNDTHITQAVQWKLQVPTSGVTVTGGPLHQTFRGNVDLYLNVRDPLDMLVFFAKRAGIVNPPGQCFGWDEWIKGSATGNFMMGAGNALRWAANETQLMTNLQTVINGIQAYQAPDGWLWAFNESDIITDNLPDYCAAWVTRGLLDSYVAGVDQALDLARQSSSTFNNHSSLPFILPQNGGPNPVQPYPAGFDNVTHGGYGQASGHMIYIEYQGMIKHTLMALSDAGTQADVDLIEEHYQEDWWLQALLARDPFHGIWHRQFFSHNYEITAFEAFLDMYVLTGNSTYLTAMLNAWSMLREAWILPSGVITLNENNYYPPQSYFIGFRGINVASGHHAHAHAHAEAHAHEEEGEGDPQYYHAPCMPGPGVSTTDEEEGTYRSPLQVLRSAAMEPEHHEAAVSYPNDSDPPTGELCGSVFWSHFNQRFHRLFPDNETFVAEIERSILNVGVAAFGFPGSGGQGPNGTGIRYFANQHKQKQNPSMHASCCEGQGTRLFGALPEFVYTTATSDGSRSGPVTGVYVDLYAASTINFTVAGGGAASLTQDTAWPYGTTVSITLTLPSATTLDLALRMPYWVAAASVPVSINGSPYATAGVPGTYLHINQAWPAGATTIAYSLPMAFSAHNYTGSSQIPPYNRYSYLYGPVSLAAEGPWNTTIDALVMPQSANLDPANPAAWMQPAGDGNSLHFTVAGAQGYTFKPYYEIQTAGELFSVFPCF